MTRRVALLRAVNVGKRKLPMAELRALCGDLGWSDVATYIQTGNVVFSASGEQDALETALEGAIASRFKLDVPVIIRTAGQWAAYARQVPFAAAARDSPNRVLLMVSKAPPATESLQALRTRATAGEQVDRTGDVFWIHYSAGVGRSGLTPSLIDRAIGSSTTGRNFTTVLKLEEMLG